MYNVLIVGTIEYNARVLEALPVWGDHSGFAIAKKVYDGNEALNELRQTDYDLMITEIDLHGLDGLQLLRHINQEKIHTLVVILSDTVEFSYVRECIMFGAFDYLQKMPDSQTVLTMLGRAAEELVTAKKHSPKATDLQYPSLEENRIVQGILNHEQGVKELFSNTVDQIYAIKREQELQNDMLVKQLYLNIIRRVFESCKWLYQYVAPDYYEKLDYLWTGSASGFKAFFLRKLTHLAEFVDKLYLSTQDKGLRSLMEYILNNPEADLRLKSVAEKVFLNYSYLSSNFSAKFGIRYNEYIVNVKMARAAYLLLNTDMKVYEVCAAVSYQDTNYFTRQFKKLYSVSPSEYKTVPNDTDAMDYSCL